MMKFNHWDLEAIINLKYIYIYSQLKKKFWTKEIMSYLMSLHLNFHNIYRGFNSMSELYFIYISVKCFYINSK